MNPSPSTSVGGILLPMNSVNRYGHLDKNMRLRSQVSDNIIKYRDLRKMSNATLALEARVSKSHLCNVLRCENNPSLEWLLSIATVLGVKVEDLVREYHEDPNEYCTS